MVVVVVVTVFMVVVVVATVVILVFVVLCCVVFVVLAGAQINPIGRFRSSIQLHTAGCLKVLVQFKLLFFPKGFVRRILQLHLKSFFQDRCFRGQKRLDNFQ